MAGGNALLDKAKISAAASAVIIVSVICAMAWFFKEVPNKRDVESNEAMSLRISAWVKEEISKVDARAVASEARVTSMEAMHYQEILRRLEVMEGVERDILSRLPRRVAGK